MQDDITPLRVADEAFLVSSTIERCPKTMMLRELVMNALEAARDGTAPKQVSLRVAIIERARKLSIWNTGTGLSAVELDRICDLASTLRKTSGLDGNFGMGAKVASLPSNRHGMRFRSCRQGRVSEVVLGQRGGIYGRLPAPTDAPLAAPGVVDATEGALRDGLDLTSDWTEVVLLGQRPAQDTVADPYGGDPASDANWLWRGLAGRFFRLPFGVVVSLEPGLGANEVRRFVPIGERQGAFDRTESVVAANGIIVHFAYAARPSGESGCGMIAFGDELYGLVDGARWPLDGPVFGFTFAARHCRVVVELPQGFGVRPEVYRQFLRFRSGDQRQVFLSDFAALVRMNMPPWLREIIASFGPARPDYLSEIRTELSSLLEELAVAPSYRDSDRVRGEESDVPEAEAEDAAEAESQPQDPPSPPTQFERPPAIIGLRDEAEIADKGMTGRAAIYHPATHELFVNLSYSAIEGAKAHLGAALGAVPDPERAATMIAEVAEALITRRVARAAVFGLSKQGLGWSGEEIGRVQSAEALSLAADDFHALLPGAHQLLAGMLGVAVPDAAFDSRTAVAARQLATSIAEAKQSARRSDGERRSAGFMRRVGELELSRGNVAEAAEWGRRALEVDPTEQHNHLFLANVALKDGRFDEAETYATDSLACAAARPAASLALLSNVARGRGDLPRTIDYAQQAADAATLGERVGLLIHLSYLHVEAGDLEAARAAMDATELIEGQTSRVLRRHGEIAMNFGETNAAIALAEQAMAADPADPAPFLLLTSAHLRNGHLKAAGDAIGRALAMKPERPLHFLHVATDVSLQAGDLTTALEFIDAAIVADPANDHSANLRSVVLDRMGDVAGARAAVMQAIDRTASGKWGFYRRMGEISRDAGDPDDARQWFERAIADNPADPYNYIVMSDLHQRAGDLGRAWEATWAGLERVASPRGGLLRQAAQVSLHRGDVEAATRFIADAIALEPHEPWNYHIKSEILQHAGDIEGSIVAQREAIRVSAPMAVVFRSRLDAITAADAEAAAAE